MSGGDGPEESSVDNLAISHRRIIGLTGGLPFWQSFAFGMVIALRVSEN